MIRRLGGKAWRRLHRWVYLIACAGVMHFWWLVKKDIREPATFALILAVLLSVRVIFAARDRNRGTGITRAVGAK
jgi:sulfoxide reductase heme-binding subunit YedZ